MGPLHGIRLIEFAGIGPGPFAAMMLADMGAEVVRIDRAKPPGGGDPTRDFLNRGRRSVAVDLKHPDAASALLRMLERADGLLEGFRPGVMERLGLGPDDCLARNPRLVYGRMTGWGQEGPLVQAAGHDINYIALAGALHCFSRAGERPVPPLNLVGDFGGGGMLLAFGMVCGLLEAARSGRGQVVDAAMVDGSAALMAMIYAFVHMGIWQDAPGTNILDTGAPFYDVYETADDNYVAVGAIEPQFYAELVKRTGLDADDEAAPLPWQLDRSQWPAMKERFAALFRQKTRDEWCEVLEGTDACFAPVLSLSEAPAHPHNVARATFVTRDGAVQPAPAPRFSRTEPSLELPPPAPGQHTAEVLADWGFSREEIETLEEAGAIA